MKPLSSNVALIASRIALLLASLLASLLAMAACDTCSAPAPGDPTGDGGFCAVDADCASGRCSLTDPAINERTCTKNGCADGCGDGEVCVSELDCNQECAAPARARDPCAEDESGTTDTQCQAFDHQCEAGLECMPCNLFDPNFVCFEHQSICISPGPAGATCNDTVTSADIDGCAEGLRCARVGINGIGLCTDATQKRAVGDSCDSDADCAVGTCISFVVQGVVQTDVPKVCVDDACDFGGDGSDCPGAVCDRDDCTTSCAAPLQDGAPCIASLDNPVCLGVQQSRCDAGLACFSPDASAPACHAALQVGEGPCSEPNGFLFDFDSGCAQGLVCGPNGTCE